MYIIRLPSGSIARRASRSCSLCMYPNPPWPLQDIRLLRDCCARINHPFIHPAHLHCPPWCNTIARLLGSIRLPFRPPMCMLIHRTILVITISCKGQTAPTTSACLLHPFSRRFDHPSLPIRRNFRVTGWPLQHIHLVRGPLCKNQSYYS